MNQIDLYKLLENRSEVIRRLYFVLVHRGYREDRIGVTRHPINDTLEMQFKINVSDLIKDATICVCDNLLARLDICEELLFAAAMDNTQFMCPYLLQSIEEALHIDLGLEDIPMYVLTNKQLHHGAGVILYPGMKNRIEELIGDFVVLPSSIHETILIPESLNNPEVVNIIQEVNRTTVDELEVLSDRPYKLIEDMVLKEVEFAK